VVILADSSAWIEYLRATRSDVDRRLDGLIAADEESLVTTEVVHLELLAGAQSDAEALQLRRLLVRYELVPLEGLPDYEEAAAIYRTCRRQGETIRTRFDCLIAAVAIRVNAEILHHDRDFEAIARHTPLRLAS
jgi:predicted nucleic acid-binding protein